MESRPLEAGWSVTATARPCPPFLGLLRWTHTLFWAHLQLQARPHSRPLRLSLNSQTESSLQVCPLKSEFQHPTAAHTSRWASWAAWEVQRCDNDQKLCWSLLAPLAIGQLPHSPMGLEAPCLSQLTPSKGRRLLVRGNVSSFIAPFQGCRSILIPPLFFL